MMGMTMRRMLEIAKEKERERHAKNPGMALGQMTFTGFAMREARRAWTVPKNLPEDDHEDV